MMQKLTLLTIARPGVFGATDTSHRMFMQRRGVSTQREYENPEHNFFVIETPNGRWDVTIGDKVRQTFAHYQGRQAVEEYIQGRTGVAFRFAEETLAYCFSNSQLSPIAKDDLFLSPLRYEPGSDTIRHVPTNICVTAFEDGKFEVPILDVDKAAAPYLGAVVKALNAGFHSCDTAQGNDHCKRRLAWLAGAYLLQDTPGKHVVAVLARDMASPVRVPLH